MKPKLLDLFCGAGGTSMGYYRAGFEVEGVDNEPQPNYPFKFYQADALDFPLDGYDAYHASPPCQAYSRLRHLPWLKGKKYPALIDPTRERLITTDKPWVIENVADAPLGKEYWCVMLCGWSLCGLPLYRHRLFETNIAILVPPHQPHPSVIYPGGKLGSRYHQTDEVMGVFGYTKGVPRSHGTFVSVVGHDGTRNFPKAKEAMGIDWMSKQELTQAIPPAYTEYIGKQLINYIVR